ncbi:a-pheromone processing metallopeptidase ste23 [Moniliophthora roreri]|nr:a-pheromone processing metallopeptidase ste23 [Moniliophthora roreri]
MEMEEMRRAIEEYSGKRDPARDTRVEDTQDTRLFEWLENDAEQLKDATKDESVEFSSRAFRVVEAHRPIVARFGRYPHRKGVVGRTAAQEGKDYLEETNHWGVPRLSEEELEKLRQQVSVGEWDTLSDHKKPWYQQFAVKYTRHVVQIMYVCEEIMIEWFEYVN